MDHPALRLAAALSDREEGQVWLEYLQPERLLMTDNPAELADLALRYRGVTANPDLAWVSRLDGFSETVGWLSQRLPLETEPVRPATFAKPSQAENPQGNSESNSQGNDSRIKSKKDEPTLAPALPEEENVVPKQEKSAIENLPAPAADATTSI
jgi:hypothetical protein